MSAFDTLKSSYRRFVDFGVSDALTVTERKHIRITNVSAMVTAAMVFPWIPVNLAAGAGWLSLQILLVGSGILFVLYLNHRRRHRTAVVTFFALAHLQLAWSLWIYGAETGILSYYILLVFLPYVAIRNRFRYAAHVFSAVAALLMVVLTYFRDHFPAQVIILNMEYQPVVNTAATVLGLLLLAASFRQLVKDAEDGLQQERERADSLLLNVLPPSVAERLKQSPNESIADRYPGVSVLFADIVGFTPLSTQLSAAQTVELLNQVFTQFDAICARPGVEKIRTIGDGYMVIAGAPNRCEHHASVLTEIALEMLDYMSTNPTGQPLRVRIGINSGEVVAGIVGTSRFHYDVWGDSVNIAARMESLGEPGKVHIAKNTWSLIRERYDCVARGPIDVKGKGKMETWFVTGPRVSPQAS